MPLKCPNCDTPCTQTYDYPEGTIFICTSCRLQWATQYPRKQEEECRYYFNPESLKDLDAYPPFTAFFDALRELKGEGPFRILDIGCGNASFLSHALAKGHECHGIEANPQMATHMPDHIKERVTFDYVENVDLEKLGRYDIVTFWDSFEHIPTAFDILAPVRALLKDDGLAYVRVNNNDEAYNRVTSMALRINRTLGSRLLRSCFNFPDHYWNFSREAMTSMLNRAGWKVLRMNTSDTPAYRLTDSTLFRLAINAVYVANKALGTGKIGEYWIQPR